MTKRDAVMIVTRLLCLLLLLQAASYLLETPLYSTIWYLWRLDEFESLVSGGRSDQQAVLSLGGFILGFVLTLGLAFFLFKFGPRVSRYFDVEEKA
jgi:hypothetical protein